MLVRVNKNMQRKPVVYGLRASGVYGYVGSTRVNMETRMWEHRSRARSGHAAPVYDWMREVGMDDVEVVELATGEDLEALEVEWIGRLMSEGHPLRNQLSRDGRLNAWSDDSKRRVGDTNRGKPTWIKGKTGEAAGWTEERRLAQSERMRARAAARRGQ